MDALDTAIELYLQKGYLHNDRSIEIKKGNPYCTTSYGNVKQKSARHSDTWTDVAVYPIDIQFDMPSNNDGNPPLDKENEVKTLLTENDDLLRLGQYERFIMRWDGVHRVWYTLEGSVHEVNDVITPDMACQAYDPTVSQIIYGQRSAFGILIPNSKISISNSESKNIEF